MNKYQPVTAEWMKKSMLADMRAQAGPRASAGFCEVIDFPTVSHHRKKIITLHTSHGDINSIGDRKQLAEAKKFWDALIKAKMMVKQPFSGPVGLDMRLVFPYPKSMPKSNHIGPMWKHTYPDTSNMLKTIEDSLQRCEIVKNDSQFAVHYLKRMWGPASMVALMVFQLSDEPMPWEDLEAEQEPALEMMDELLQGHTIGQLLKKAFSDG